MSTKNHNSNYPDRVTLFIEIHAKEGKEEIVREVFTTTIATSEKPGLLGYKIYEDSSDPGCFYSTQEWENEEAFHAHMRAAKTGLNEAVNILREPPRTNILRRIG